ncbi:MAG: hypothetical protein KF771_11915 [Burkholderiales bacterium]|nr:hypothetical protein [Burkholderiales bacterium]
MNSKLLRIPILALLMAGMAAGVLAQQGRGCVNDRYGNPQCPPPGGRCLADINGEIRCSPPGGGILLDRYRMPVCGPGQCMADRNGDIVCSKTRRGSAATNINGDVVCTGGCIAASAAACAVPVK